MTDSETGESRTLDRETGETLKATPHVCRARVTRDAETGEPEVGGRGAGGPACRHRPPFQVPRSVYASARGGRGARRPRPRNLLPRAAPEHMCCLEERMVTGSQNVSPVVFMLPTLFMCPAWAAVLCCMLEVCIHVWAHKCDRLHQRGVAYKSPLHVVTSEFCARCRSDRVMHTVGKLQDERRLKIDSRKLGAYMERVSSLVTKI